MIRPVEGSELRDVQSASPTFNAASMSTTAASENAAMRSCCLTQISIGIKRNTLTVIDLSAVLPQLIRDTDHFSIMLSDKFRKDGRLCGRLLAGALCVQSAELPDRCISRQTGMIAQVTLCHSERWKP